MRKTIANGILAAFLFLLLLQAFQYANDAAYKTIELPFGLGGSTRIYTYPGDIPPPLPELTREDCEFVTLFTEGALEQTIGVLDPYQSAMEEWSFAAFATNEVVLEGERYFARREYWEGTPVYGITSHTDVSVQPPAPLKGEPLFTVHPISTLYTEEASYYAPATALPSLGTRIWIAPANPKALRNWHQKLLDLGYRLEPTANLSFLSLAFQMALHQYHSALLIGSAGFLVLFFLLGAALRFERDKRGLLLRVQQGASHAQLLLRVLSPFLLSFTLVLLLLAFVTWGVLQYLLMPTREPLETLWPLLPLYWAFMVVVYSGMRGVQLACLLHKGGDLR